MSTLTTWGRELITPSSVWRPRTVTSAFLPLPCARFVSAVRPDSHFLSLASVFLLPAAPANVLSPSAIAVFQQPREEQSRLSLFDCQLNIWLVLSAASDVLVRW